jgi:hypothetical protein
MPDTVLSIAMVSFLDPHSNPRGRDCYHPTILQMRKLRLEVVQCQPRQKVHKIPSRPIKLGMVAHACHPSFAGSINRRAMVQAELSIK